MTAPATVTTAATGPGPRTPQRLAVPVLGRLVRFGNERGLPPLTWTTTPAGDIAGGSATFPYAARVAELESWLLALTVAIGKPDVHHDHTSTPSGVRVIASVWETRPGPAPVLREMLCEAGPYQVGQLSIGCSVLPDDLGGQENPR